MELTIVNCAESAENSLPPLLQLFDDGMEPFAIFNSPNERDWSGSRKRFDRGRRKSKQAWEILLDRWADSPFTV